MSISLSVTSALLWCRSHSMQNEMEALLSKHSINDALLKEVETLREQNRLLQQRF